MKLTPEQEAAINQIAASNDGCPTAEMVVQEATNPNSPLHPLFPWNDKEAAHQRRLEIAREVIRNVHVEITHHDVTIRVSGYVRDPQKPTDQQGYRSIYNISRCEEDKRAVLEYELKQIESLVRRALGIAHASKVEYLDKDFDKLVKTLSNMRDKVTAKEDA